MAASRHYPLTGTPSFHPLATFSGLKYYFKYFKHNLAGMKPKGEHFLLVFSPVCRRVDIPGGEPAFLHITKRCIRREPDKPKTRKIAAMSRSLPLLPFASFPLFDVEAST